MEMNEFLQSAVEPEAVPEPEEIDVQRAVVESLAADKAERDEQISSLRKENYALKSQISKLEEQLAAMKASLDNVGEVLAKNSELPLSSQVSLLERNTEIADRFEGETHDQLIEVLREARDLAEKEGRVRRAQILESVLVENITSGNLEKRREALKKLFKDNSNILSGPVLAELDKLGISYKNGEEYLLCEEIVKRTY